MNFSQTQSITWMYHYFLSSYQSMDIQVISNGFTISNNVQQTALNMYLSKHMYYSCRLDLRSGIADCVHLDFKNYCQYFSRAILLISTPSNTYRKISPMALPAPAVISHLKQKVKKTIIYYCFNLHFYQKIEPLSMFVQTFAFFCVFPIISFAYFSMECLFLIDLQKLFIQQILIECLYVPYVVLALRMQQ